MVTKKAADRYGLSIKDFCNIYLALVPHSMGIRVFPKKKNPVYTYCVYLYVQNIHLLVSITCLHTHINCILL